MTLMLGKPSVAGLTPRESDPPFENATGPFFAGPPTCRLWIECSDGTKTWADIHIPEKLADVDGHNFHERYLTPAVGAAWSLMRTHLRASYRFKTKDDA